MYSIQNFTSYSKDFGIGTPKKWIEAMKKNGYKAVAFTDRSTLAGAIKLQQECDKHGILPIHGMDVYFNVSQAKNDNNKNPDCRIILLAKSHKGFLNLIKINNLSKDPNGPYYYYRPRVTPNLLVQHLEDVVCVVSVDGAEKALNDPKLINILKSMFGDNFYYGLNPLKSPESLEIIKDLLINSQDEPFVLTFNYITPVDGQEGLAKDLALMDSGMTKTNLCNSPNPQSLKDAKYIESLFTEKELEALAEKEAKFLAQFSNYLKLGNYSMPKPNCADVKQFLDETLTSWFRKKLYPALDPACNSVFDIPKFLDLDKHYSHTLLQRNDPVAKKYTLKVYHDRLLMEFDVISQLKFLDYFYHVWDICNVIDQGGFIRGPARGSAGGSIFSYLLNITMIDPVRFELPFER